MSIGTGEFVIAQVVDGTAPVNGAVEYANDWGISIASLNPDELPTHIFLPWTSVACVHTFKRRHDADRFWDALVATATS